jgi:hypothetical protein
MLDRKTGQTVSGPPPRYTDDQIIEVLQRHTTLTAAAKDLGYTRQTLSEIVNGRRRPRVRRKLETLAAAEATRTDQHLDRLAPMAFARLAQRLQDTGKAGDWAAAEIMRLWAGRKRDISRNHLIRRLSAKHAAIQPAVNAVINLIVNRLPKDDALHLAQELRQAALVETTPGGASRLSAPGGSLLGAVGGRSALNPAVDSPLSLSRASQNADADG